VYLIFSLIDSLSFAPVACSENSDDIVAVGKPNGENPTANPAETVVPQLFGTMGMVFGDDTPRIGKGALRHRKGHSVFSPVLLVLLRIPIEPSLRHGGRLAQVWPRSHINVWSRYRFERAT
jgi:hypothetical protein